MKLVTNHKDSYDNMSDIPILTEEMRYFNKAENDPGK